MRWPPAEERFWSNVDKSQGCWTWTGYTNGRGYGRIRWYGRTESAHRVSLMLVGVELPEGMDVDHLCRNTLCVRPDHLEVVDHRTNTLRGVGIPARNAQRDECIHGHRLDKTMGNRRRCSECDRRVWRDSKRRMRARQKVAR